MAHILKARVAESSTSTSTGDMTLAGALTGHVTYASVCSIGDTTEYVIYGADAYGFPTGEWEEGIGTYSALNKLTRTTPKGGSTTTPVDFSAGTKIVIMTPLGSRVGAIPRGGSINQVLSKASGNDHDLVWADVAAAGIIDATPTDGSANAVSSNGVFDALAGKADTGHNHSGVYDPAGTSSAALSAHTGAADPHPGYALESALGTAAALNVPATGDAASGEVVKGSDTRLSDARTPTAHNQAASTISDSTTVGRAVLTAVDAAAARSAIGAGTSSFDGAYASLSGKPTLGDAAAKNTGTTTGTVAAGDHTHSSYAGTGAIGSSGLTMATSKLLGRSTAGTGAPEEITLGTNLSFSGTTLNAAGGSGTASPALNISLSTSFGGF